MVVESTVRIAGVQLAYIESGSQQEDSGPAVLYVHGNLGSFRWFTRVMNIPGVKTYALDMPNFGRSDHIPGCSIIGYVPYIGEFIERVTGAPVILVGHSLGGAVSMGLAGSRPDLVRGLVLVDSAPPEGLQTPEAYHPVIEDYRKDKNKLSAALKTVVPTLSDERLFEELVDDARRMKGEAYVGHAVELGKADFSEAASNYRGPALVIRGGRDQLITNEMAKRTASAFHAEYREFPDFGHSIMVEAPEQFRGIIREFVFADSGPH